MDAPALLCALLWGATDALMKHLAPPATAPTLSTTLVALLSSPAYLACLLVNQVGSLAYYVGVSLGRLSTVSPAANTGKFLVTVLVGRWLGEPELPARKLLGLGLLLLGVLLQMAA